MVKRVIKLPQLRILTFVGFLPFLLAACHGVGLQKDADHIEVRATGSAIPPTSPVDCSGLIRYEPSSTVAQEIVDTFVRDFQRQQPTEYMAFEQLWAIDEVQGFLLIQGLVTQEESDLIIVRRTPQGLEMAGRITSHVRGLRRDNLLAQLRAHVPDAPEKLLACADFGRFLGSLPP